MSNNDKLYRYLFENQSVRGELVNVSETLQAMLGNHDYPLPVQQVLGELLVATCLLTATLKFSGDITVQLQGDGPMPLAVINGNNQQDMRGVARIKGEVPENATLKQLSGNGYLVITITPTEGERYQGIVSLEGETLAECIEQYFQQSEQLPTKLFIHAGNHNNTYAAAGMLLQVLPSNEDNSTQFEHLATLTETIKAEELFTLDVQEVLRRLYHEEDVTLFEAQQVQFRCTCSRERSANSLRTLGDEELKQILAEKQHVDIQCDFCGKHYVFDLIDIEAILANNNTPASVTNGSSNIH